MQKCLKFFLRSRKLSKPVSYLNLIKRSFFYKTNIKLFNQKNEETLQLDQKTSNDNSKTITAEAQERVTINRN
jgi:hypothetical protein